MKFYTFLSWGLKVQIWRVPALICISIQLGTVVSQTGNPATTSSLHPPPTNSCQPVNDSHLKCKTLGGRGTAYSLPEPTREQLLSINTLDDGLIEAAIFFGMRDNVPPACIDVVAHLICLIAAPPCNPNTSLPALICEENCRIYQQVRAADICRQVDDFATSSASPINGALLDHILELVALYLNFNCSDPSTYLFVNETIVVQPDPDLCTNIFSPEHTEFFLAELSRQNGGDNNSNSSTEVLLKAILPSVLFILLVLIIVLVPCGCYCCRKKKRDIANDINPAVVCPEGRFTVAFSNTLSLELDHYPITQGHRYQEYRKAFSKFCIKYQNLEIGDVIGQGAFGRVLKGKYLSGNEVAIKTLKDEPSARDIMDFFSESIIMKDFHHPNVLGLLGVVFDTPDGVPYLVLPFMKNGNLKDYLKSRRVEASDIDTLPQDIDIMKICIDVAEGMKYLAENKFVHRDLAARNCMVSEDLVVKVGDFGLARDVYSTDYYHAGSKHARLPVKWMAPESFSDNISTEKTDVWSFGVTCWEVFSLGRTPYPTVPNSDIFSYISKGRRLEKPSLCPEQMYALLKTSWERRPEDRPTFTHLTRSLKEHAHWNTSHEYYI